MWAERLAQTRIGMEPLNRTRPLKGEYLPDGKIGTRYLVSVKSGAKWSLRLDLSEWLLHVQGALSERRRPLLVIALREPNPVLLVAMTPDEFLELQLLKERNDE